MKKRKYEAPVLDITTFVTTTNLMSEFNPNEGDGNIINVHGTSETDIDNGDFDPSQWNF
ncbi:MAG: hypothetical protein IKN54_06875 [Lachnospiraceae bacterium]|nr:hypothetical protein [Lachnospiraceae bacterium]